MKTIQIRQVIGRIACNKTLYYVIDQNYDVIKHLNVMVKYICDAKGNVLQTEKYEETKLPERLRVTIYD